MLVKRKKIVLSVAFALGLSQTPTWAQFDPITELSGLNDQTGFTINGVTANDLSGFSVSKAGDVNGDGIDDLIIGAIHAGPNDNNLAGSSYVVFGSDDSLPNPFNLSNLNGQNGFIINGVAADDYSGRSVAAAGDVNGDGIDDLIIGAHGADPNGNSYSGSSYVVFGSTSGLPNPLDLASLNGQNGFAINGVAANDRLGSSVAAAGDVNGDGIDDLIVGAPNAEPNGNEASGSSYVVFGSTGGLPNPFDLTTLDGQNGFVINGVTVGDLSGVSVAAAGDINGDGIDDLIIGARRANVNGIEDFGSSYVVFGSINSSPNPFDLTSLNGQNGFVLNGVAANELSGISVSAAGDVNSDGIDDLIIGAELASPNSNSRSGRSYVVFGSNISFPNPFNLFNLNGQNGFTLNGVATNDYSGRSVSGAGDFNGDGIDDLIIGAFGANSNGNNAGSSYVVFGREKPIFKDGFE